MLGIETIASYIPADRISNFERKELFEIDDYFIEEKLGIARLAIKGKDEDTSQLCMRAFENLSKKIGFQLNEIDIIVVVTQNPDSLIPHVSAVLHGELNLNVKCMCFDVSLGCTGFVQGLSITKAVMDAHNLKFGLLFTADPYSNIIDPNDKNTSMLFGDAATVTLITHQPRYTIDGFSFGSAGKENQHLAVSDGKLHMNGRAIFNFVIQNLPNDIKTLLAESCLTFDEIDKFVFHQASKYIIDILARRLNLSSEKVPVRNLDYGNTVSSSIPIILEEELENVKNNIMLISGFGVGLAWANAILFRREK